MNELLVIPPHSISRTAKKLWIEGTLVVCILGILKNALVARGLIKPVQKKPKTKAHIHKYYRFPIGTRNGAMTLMWISIPAVFFCSTTKSWAQLADSLVIERILIVGNERTREEIIRREMRLREGDYFDAQMAEQDRRRVQNLRLFHQVELQTFRGEIGTVVCIMVTERWYVFPFPIFFLHNKNWHEVSYGAGLTWENLWGRNITTTTSMWFGFNRCINIRYYDPWLSYSKRISFDGSIFISRMPQLSVEYGEYEVIRNGGMINVGWRSGFHSTFSLSMGYQQVRLPRDHLLGATYHRYDHLPQLGCQFLFDHRDYYAYPKQGWYVLLSGSALTDGGSIHFGFLKGDIRRYQPLIAKVSIASRVCLEKAIGEIPVYERLLIGQQVRIRGHFYDLYEGENRFLAGLEGRFPLIPIRYLDMDSPASFMGVYGQNLPVGLSAAIFLDTGSVWYHDRPLRRVVFRTGYGVGLHVHLPYMELLRLERAWDLQGNGQYIIDLKAWF